jgi:hypothetical protein
LIGPEKNISMYKLKGRKYNGPRSRFKGIIV